MELWNSSSAIIDFRSSLRIRHAPSLPNCPFTFRSPGTPSGADASIPPLPSRRRCPPPSPPSDPRSDRRSPVPLQSHITDSNSAEEASSSPPSSTSE
ncbi:hypothetical protein QR680_009119 [Steinernema hermaphroditum]|uniref:Uncharacterized protein n=1 Tax=Steinernema hermaphroditum TaxID=289476 RepID=A0AA39IKI9_9BILA|nr:hypothetical protein QR680_009119 [Steinernema hermaphroditum]